MSRIGNQKWGLQWRGSGIRRLHRYKNYDNKDQDEGLEAEYEIDEGKLAYF